MAQEVDGKLVERLRRYCALQDRSEASFRRKAMELGLHSDQTQSLIPTLRDQGFLDDARFAETYVRALIRDKRWGPVKLTHGLRSHDIAEGLQAVTVGRVPERVWQENLQTLLAQRPAPAGEDDRARLVRWLQGKGYRVDQILPALDAAP